MNTNENSGKAAIPEMQSENSNFSETSAEQSMITPEKINEHFNQLTKQMPEQVGFFTVRTANQCLKDAKAQPIPRDLYCSLLFEGEITILFANTGVGKTILSVQIGNEIAKENKVLYFDLELSDKQFQKRYSENYQSEFIFNDNFIRICFARPLIVPDGKTYEDYFIDSLRAIINSTGARIVIIDNMTALISGDTDKARIAKPLMDTLQNLKFEYNLSLLLLEHTRKTDPTKPIHLNDMQGSKMKSNFADAIFSIGESAKDKSMRYVKQLKVRSGENYYHSDNVIVYEIVKEDSFTRFRLIEYGTESDHLKELTAEDKANKKKDAFDLKADGLSNREIARRLFVSEGAVRKWLKTQ